MLISRAGDLDVLGRDGVDERYGIIELADKNDNAEIAPGGARYDGARQRL